MKLLDELRSAAESRDGLPSILHSKTLLALIAVAEAADVWVGQPTEPFVPEQLGNLAASVLALRALDRERT